MGSATTDRNQDRFFADGEGDNFYRRNRDVLRSRGSEVDPPQELLQRFAVRPRSVLEFGCANGFRLAQLHERYGCRAVGVDPSREAIEEGGRDYPGIELHLGTMADAPLGDETFDLVVVHFVFHWNARETLLEACASVDRRVADGGLLSIGDFLPAQPQRRAYHHAADGRAYTYKQHYAEIFLASNLYQEVARLTFDADAADQRRTADVEPDRRGICSLLRKSWTDGYPSSGGTA